MLDLEVKNLTVSFRTGKGMVHAVRDISFNLKKGETLAIVGESGSGKSVTAKAILGLESPNAVIEGGQILYAGKDLLKCTEKEFNRIRGSKITMVFQDPMSSLDPIVKIGTQMTEASILNGRASQRAAARDLKKYLDDLKDKFDIKLFSSVKKQVRQAEKSYAAYFSSADFDNFISLDALTAAKDAPDFLSGLNLEPEQKERLRALICKKTFKVTGKLAYKKALSIMQEVGITDGEKRFNQYPFEFSGGMRQRIVIAIAIAANPELLICDEPTTALDVTIQAQILELINRLKKSRNMSVIFITHDLGVVANVADRIAVMYAGKIVETGTSRDIFYSPAHPYTWALLSSMPDLNTKNQLEAIPGTPPNMLKEIKGDAFAPRNKYAMQIDLEMEPPMFKISETHQAATWLLHPLAPKIEIPEQIKERMARLRNAEVNDEQ